MIECLTFTSSINYVSYIQKYEEQVKCFSDHYDDVNNADGYDYKF